MLKKCMVCEGKGYVMAQVKGRSFGIECDVCDGKGGFDVPDNKELCPTCKGKRKITVQTAIKGLGMECNCKTCFGTGFIDKA